MDDHFRHPVYRTSSNVVVDDELGATCSAIGENIVELVKYNICDTNPIILPSYDDVKLLTTRVAVSPT